MYVGLAWHFWRTRWRRADARKGLQAWERAAIQQDIAIKPIELPYNQIEISDEDRENLQRFAKQILELPHLNVAIEPMASPQEIAEFGKESDPFPLFDILEARTQSVSAVLEDAGLLSDRIRKRGSPPWDFEDFLADDPDFLKRYQARAVQEKVDPLGFYLPPYNYTIGQMLEQAVTATKSLDHKVLANYLRKNEMKTIVGPIRYGPDGEWANPRVVQAQFRGVKDKDMEQFRKSGSQVVLYPDAYKTGDFIWPFEKARK